ncbi:MAG: hypothetical protein ABL876_13610, partial [Chitinophagaceae bacterium]
VAGGAEGFYAEKLMSRVRDDEVSDTTGDDQGTEADKVKIIRGLLRLRLAKYWGVCFGCAPQGD